VCRLILSRSDKAVCMHRNITVSVIKDALRSESVCDSGRSNSLVIAFRHFWLVGMGYNNYTGVHYL